MSKWISKNISKDFIISKNETSSLISIPYSHYRFWWKNKIIKELTNNELRLLYTTDSTFHIFKTKKEEGKWIKYDERKIDYHEFVNLFENENYTSLSVEKNYIRKETKTSYLIGFFNENSDFISFWIDKKYCKIYSDDIVLIFPFEFEYEFKLYIDDITNKDFILNGEKARNYISHTISYFKYDKTLVPKRLNVPQDVTIDVNLIDDECFSETGMLRTKTKLYDHQIKAVAKILPSRYNALFMDMGTGKTRTALEIIRLRQQKYNRLIWFTPVSLKYNIYLEFLKHTNLKKDDVYFFDNKTDDTTIIDQKFIIVGIESLSSSDRIHLSLEKLISNDDFIVMDESSFIKGYSARTSRLISLTKDTKYRMILTGTPISQGIIDLYTQFNFLSPRILGYKNFWQFAKHHLRYSDKFPGMVVSEHNEAYIAAKINPYIYQIKKEECLDLPDKKYISKFFEMNSYQRAYYNNVKEEFFNNFMSYEEDSIFELFNKLQQISSGFRYMNESIEDISDNRLNVLKDIIDEINHKDSIIIWTKYTYNIKQIKKLLDTTYGENSCVIFDGTKNELQKEQTLHKFTNDVNVRFFLATQSTGAYGLNLTKATYTIFYNNGFKYSERIQAEDRNYRIGQDRAVTYIDVICNNSIDVKIDNTLYYKSNVVSNFKNEVNSIKDKKLKKALLNAIIDGNLDEAEKIKKQAAKNSVAKRMEKHRRKKGVIDRQEYLEKNSINRNMPWKKEGISRATWYRNKTKQKVIT